MKMKFGSFIMTALLLSVANSSQASEKASDSASCDKLNAIRQAYKTVKAGDENKVEAEYTALQTKATDVIQKMDSTKKLTPKEITALVEILAVATPVDPSEAIVVNNLEIIKTNRKAIEGELQRFPKATRDRVSDAIETAITEDETGNNSKPAKKK